jgi:5-methylthioribose kinase
MDPGLLTAVSLGGGVSNNVVLVEGPDLRLVLKQSLPKLRVKEDWFSDRERIFRESQALIRLAPQLPAGAVPRILFEDRQNFAYAMAAAPAGAVTWKDELLAGLAKTETAERIGRIHGDIVRCSWHQDDWAQEFGDQTAFEQLRLHAYYEFTARKYPELANEFAHVLARCRMERHSLVHGDWSPKNMMVFGSDVMSIDYEVIHYGDPAFDVGFLLNHLVLKSIRKPSQAAAYAACASAYWRTLHETIPEADWLEQAALLHLPLLMLARVDGKSPVEYISSDEQKKQVRDLAHHLIANVPSGIEDVFRRIFQ